MQEPLHCGGVVIDWGNLDVADGHVGAGALVIGESGIGEEGVCGGGEELQRRPGDEIGGGGPDHADAGVVQIDFPGIRIGRGFGRGAGADLREHPVKGVAVVIVPGQSRGVEVADKVVGGSPRSGDEAAEQVLAGEKRVGIIGSAPGFAGAGDEIGIVVDDGQRGAGHDGADGIAVDVVTAKDKVRVVREGKRSQHVREPAHVGIVAVVVAELNNGGGVIKGAAGVRIGAGAEGLVIVIQPQGCPEESIRPAIGVHGIQKAGQIHLPGADAFVAQVTAIQPQVQGALQRLIVNEIKVFLIADGDGDEGVAPDELIAAGVGLVGVGEDADPFGVADVEIGGLEASAGVDDGIAVAIDFADPAVGSRSGGCG